MTRPYRPRGPYVAHRTSIRAKPFPVAKCWGCGTEFAQRSNNARSRFCWDKRCRELHAAYTNLDKAIDALERAGRKRLAKMAIVILGNVMSHAPSRETR